MDNFKAVYIILSALEKCMDLPQANIEIPEWPTQNGASFNKKEFYQNRSKKHDGWWRNAKEIRNWKTE